MVIKPAVYSDPSKAKCKDCGRTLTGSDCRDGKCYGWCQHCNAYTWFHVARLPKVAS